MDGMVLVVSNNVPDTVGIMFPVIDLPAFVTKVVLLDGMALFATKVILLNVFFLNLEHRLVPMLY